MFHKLTRKTIYMKVDAVNWKYQYLGNSKAKKIIIASRKLPVYPKKIQKLDKLNKKSSIFRHILI